MEEMFPELINFRRYLHQHPELSLHEKETSAYILKAIERCKPDHIIKFNNYGLAVVFRGKESGKNLMIRGDFDALPITETNEFEYKSIYPGVSHKCGHDGHAAILYGLTLHYDHERPQQGDVILLFQPAEENGEGAKGILQSNELDQLKIDFTVALHNLPGYPKHSIIYKEGNFTAAVNSMIIRLTGKTSHAGEPERGINPALAISAIINEFLLLNRPHSEEKDFRLVTPIYSRFGEKSYGVSAGEGEVHFTLRAWDNQNMKSLESECEELARKIANYHHLSIEVDWTESFFANENDQKVVAAIDSAATKLNLNRIERDVPFRWGEDFGIFTAKYRGAMFGLGAGENMPSLHNPDYDFPDELMKTGIDMFIKIQQQLSI